MAMKVWRIVHWSESHESAESRKLSQPWWVPKPNKHDGMAFCLIAVEPDNFALYGAWTLILEVASRGPKDTRGWLMRNGRPLSSTDLMVMTRFPKAGFERAFQFLSRPDIGWLKEEEFAASWALTGEPPGQPSESPGQPGQGAGEPPGPSPAHPPVQEDRKTGRQEGILFKEEEGGERSPKQKQRDLIVQFAALQAQIKQLEGHKDELNPEQRAELRKKKRRLALIQEAQARGETQVPAAA